MSQSSENSNKDTKARCTSAAKYAYANDDQLVADINAISRANIAKGGTRSRYMVPVYQCLAPPPPPARPSPGGSRMNEESRSIIELEKAVAFVSS